MKNKHAVILLKFGLILLLAGIFFGVLSAFSFTNEANMGNWLPFRNLRPLHVSSVVFWLLSAAAGCVLYFLADTKALKTQNDTMSLAFLLIWISTIVGIITCFFFGKFGGREYWEFPPILALPVLAAWVLFAIIVTKYLIGVKGKWPVYYWMWITGVVFFIVTFAEANLWVLPWFRNNIIRDITIQWKSNGSLVGSWNMLIYGAGIYLMCKISGDEATAYSKQSFFFFFLGLTNLLFNWGHHTYLLPAAPWIRRVSYIISMTEWILFLNIIRNWRKTLSTVLKHKNLLSYKFIFASEIWVFLNLILALFMSIPVVNNYTHGTHITVAHAMGTTIGINSMILFAVIFYIFSAFRQWSAKELFIIHAGFWIVNIPLLFFWLSLLAAGYTKGYYSAKLPEGSFHDIMEKVMPWLRAFSGFGVLVMAGLAILAIMCLRVGKQQTEKNLIGMKKVLRTDLPH